MTAAPMDYLGPLFDYAAARDARDAGIESVLENAGGNFIEKACAVIKQVHSGQLLLAEEWRQTCLEYGVRPHHPNAWGGLTHALQKRGVIVRTGEFRQARSVRNHAHRYEVWHVR